MLQQLQEQHHIDLEVYQAQHQDVRNRALHWLLIPIETASFLVALACLLSVASVKQYLWISTGSILRSICWCLGLTALLIAKECRIGLAACLFHILVCEGILALLRRFGLTTSAAWSFCGWILAWTLQVGVGHWILEQNQPNVANLSSVSWLAVTQSVLIAWSL